MRHLETLAMMALTILMALAPATASAQGTAREGEFMADVMEHDREIAVVLAGIAGGALGFYIGVSNGITVGERLCPVGGLDCLGVGLLTWTAGAALGVPLGASAVAAGVSSAYDPSRSTTHVLVGAGVGALVGVGGIAAVTLPYDRPMFEERFIFALPVMTAFTGAFIGYHVPPDLSVALVPTTGGASAKVGFKF